MDTKQQGQLTIEFIESRGVGDSIQIEGRTYTVRKAMECGLELVGRRGGQATLIVNVARTTATLIDGSTRPRCVVVATVPRSAPAPVALASTPEALAERPDFDQFLAQHREYRRLNAQSLKLAEARAALPPGSSRAKVTTANARWARVAEARDLMRTELLTQWEAG